MRFVIVILVLGFAGSFFWDFSITPQEDRIVALSPAHTQFLKYLHLTDKIIAVSSYDVEPIVQDRLKLAGGVFVQEEEIAQLNPSLVLLGDTQDSDDMSNFLTKKNIPNLILSTKSMRDIYESLIKLQQTYTLSPIILSNYQLKWQDIQNTPPPTQRNALMILAIDPVYSLSTNDYLSELYHCSGWDSVVYSRNAYPVLTEENILSLTNVDDILIFPFLTNELAYISNIQQKINAENIIIISNNNVQLPSPYVLDIIKELRIIQSSL